MSEMIKWYIYYTEMTSEPSLTTDQQVSYHVAAQRILEDIRREVKDG